MDDATARKLKSGTPVEHRTLGRGIWQYASRMDGPTAAWIRRDGETRLTVVDFTEVEPAGEVQTASQGWDCMSTTQINLDQLAEDLKRLTGGRIRLYQPDTGSEDIGYVLATGELTDEEVLKAFYGPEYDPGREVPIN